MLSFGSLDSLARPPKMTAFWPTRLKTWRGGILEGGQTPPLPSRRKELVQLGGGSMVTVGVGSLVTVYMYRRQLQRELATPTVWNATTFDLAMQKTKNKLLMLIILISRKLHGAQITSRNTNGGTMLLWNGCHCACIYNLIRIYIKTNVENHALRLLTDTNVWGDYAVTTAADWW